MRLGPSLHRIGNDIVAVYLVDTPDGITLIDAGLARAVARPHRRADRDGPPVDDIRGVVLTHGDTDHIGFAERLRRDHGVPVYVHEADAARARGEMSTKPDWGHMKLGATARFLWYALTHGGMRTTHLAEVVTVRDGEVLDLPGAPHVIAHARPLPRQHRHARARCRRRVRR